MALKRQGFCWINDLSSITADNGTAIKQVDRKETGDKAIGKRKKRGREKSYIKYTKQRLYNEYTRKPENSEKDSEQPLRKWERFFKDCLVSECATVFWFVSKKATRRKPLRFMNRQKWQKLRGCRQLTRFMVPTVHQVPAGIAGNDMAN